MDLFTIEAGNRQFQQTDDADKDKTDHVATCQFPAYIVLQYRTQGAE